MKCPNCSTRIKRGASFCGRCGTRVASVENSNRGLEVGIPSPPARNRCISIPAKICYLFPAYGFFGGMAALLWPPAVAFLFWWMIRPIPWNVEVKNYLLIVMLLLASIYYIQMLIWGKYKVGRSFSFQRMSKKQIKYKNLIYILIIFLLFLLFLWLLNQVAITNGRHINIDKTIGLIPRFLYLFIIPAIIGIWISIKMHEDVDYAANQSFEDFLHLEIDEKVTASYQNFDGTETKYKKGNRLLIVTSRKFFFAYYSKKKWRSLIQRIDDISGIAIRKGLFTGWGTSRYLRIKFEDGTSLGLWLDTKKKQSANPDLFLQRLLKTIDANLTGRGMETIATPRRRRTEVNPLPTTDNPNKIKFEGKKERTLDFSPDVINDIKQAESFPIGRAIEL